MAIRPHHIGICVSDLAASLRFWCDGLGFESVASHTLGDEWARALEVGETASFSAHFIRKDGFEFELLQFHSPDTFGIPSGNRNQVGFTHLALYVDDLDDTVSRLLELGGSVVESTRTRMGEGAHSIELVFVADPDGVRVELMKAGG